MITRDPVAEEEMQRAKKDVEKEAVQLTRRSSCLLGSCSLLMADWSWKEVRDVRGGDLVMNRRLRPVRVIAANFSYLGDRKVYRLTPSGPFFTPEHQAFNAKIFCLRTIQ